MIEIIQTNTSHLPLEWRCGGGWRIEQKRKKRERTHGHRQQCGDGGGRDGEGGKCMEGVDGDGK